MSDKRLSQTAMREMGIDEASIKLPPIERRMPPSELRRRTEGPQPNKTGDAKPNKTG